MAKTFVEEPFRVSLISGIEKIYAWEGYVTTFRRIFFVWYYRNILRRNPSVLCFGKFLVAKKFMDERGGGHHDFLSSLFCLAVSKNFVVEYFCVSKSYWHRKKFMITEGRVSRFSVQIVLFQCTETFRRWTLLRFRNFLVSKNFLPTRKISRSSFENLLSHSTKKIRRRSLLCFKNCLVSKVIFCLRGEYQNLQWKICCLTVPKNFVKETFCVSEKFWFRKFFWLGGEYLDLRWKICCLIVPKNFVDEPFCVLRKFLVWKIFLPTRRISRSSFERHWFL